MKISERIEYILDKALDSQDISFEEAVELMKIDERSPEMYALMSAANSMSRERFEGTGEVHSQIGINKWPCPVSCSHCYFGEKWGLIDKPEELGPGEVVQKAKEFDDAGANLICMMSTANYPFERYIEIAKEVRKAVTPDKPLLANIGDFNKEQAKKLYDAGIRGAYHLVRVGEGKGIGIDIDLRIRTMNAMREAGVALCYGVEPIGPEHAPEEIVKEMFRGKKFGAINVTTMARVPVPGTPLAKKGTITESATARATAVTRLVFGSTIKSMGVHEPSITSLLAGANVVAAETAANPRDTAADTSEGRGLSVDDCRQMLINAGYKPLDGASQIYSYATF